MTRAETKKEAMDGYSKWPDRPSPPDDLYVAAAKFVAYLGDNGSLSYMNFGPADPYSVMHGWVQEWERTWGAVERASKQLSHKADTD